MKKRARAWSLVLGLGLSAACGTADVGDERGSAPQAVTASPAPVIADLGSLINYLFPPVSVTASAALAPGDANGGNAQKEFATTAIPSTEAAAVCGSAEPRVFVTYSPQTVIRGPESCIASGTCTASALPMPPDPTTSCRYESLYLDSVIGRLPGGRVIQAGLVGRCCVGAPPPFTPPAGCTLALTPNGGCSAGRYLTTRALAVRISSNCGASWTSTAIDSDTIRDASGTTLGLGFLDRPELYVDPFSDRVFLSARLAQTIIPLCDGFFNNTQVVLVAPKGPSTQTSLTFSTHSTQSGAPGVTVMGSVPAGGGSRFARLWCSGNQGTTAQLDVETDPGSGARMSTISVAALAGQTAARFNCAVGATPVVNVIPSLSLAAAAETDTLRALWSGVNNGFQVLHVDRVTLVPVAFPVVSPGFPPRFTTRTILFATALPELDVDLSTANTHAIWGQFVTPDQQGNAGAPDRTALLRWTELANASGTERARPFYPGTGVGGPLTLGSWTLTPSAFGAAACTAGSRCFDGDYHYGGFIERTSAGAMRFLATWSAPETAPTPPQRVRIFGAVVQTGR